MKCPTAQLLIDMRAGGDTTPRQDRRIDRHLRDCEECREVADSLSPIALQEVRSEIPLDSNDFERIRGSVMSEISEDHRSNVPALGLLAIATLLVALIAGAIVLGRAGDQSDPVIRVSERSIERPEPTSATESRVPPREERVGSVFEERHQEPVSTTPEEPGLLAASPERTQEEPPTTTPSEESAVIVASAEAGQFPVPSESPPMERRAGPGEEPHPVRIELSTSDPTIRIIWISSAASSSREQGNRNHHLNQVQEES